MTGWDVTRQTLWWEACSIKYVMDAEDVEDLCLTFCESSDHPADVVMSHDASGAMAHFELVEGGKDKDVTNQNRHEYIRYRCRRSIIISPVFSRAFARVAPQSCQNRCIQVFISRTL